MNKIKQIYQYYTLNITQEDTTSLAYYFLLSLVPSITIITMMLKVFHVNVDFIYNFINRVFSADIANMIEKILYDNRVTYLSIATIVVSVWVCSKGVYRMIGKVNELYHTKPVFFIRLKLQSILDTIIFLLLVVGLIILSTFIPLIIKMLQLNTTAKFYNYVIGFLFCFSVLLVLFYLVPSVKVKVSEVWLGALVSTIIFFLIVIGIGIYLKFANLSNIYGSFASLALLLLTCNLFAKGLYIGFVINALGKM